jgi:hypothetical protein
MIVKIEKKLAKIKILNFAFRWKLRMGKEKMDESENVWHPFWSS